MLKLSFICMFIHRFLSLEDYEKEEEIGQLSTLLGDNNNNNVPILKNPDESDNDFRNRSFSELLVRLDQQPKSLNHYKVSFFGSHGAPREIDLMIRRFIKLPVEKQDEEIGNLLGLNGGESVPKSPKESEDHHTFRIRSFFELLLKLPVDSVENYKTTFFEIYKRPLEPRTKRQSMKLKLDDEAPAGFNRDYKYKSPAN